MANENDILARQVIRQARVPSQGNRLGASSGGGAVSAQTQTSSTRIDSSGRVRKLWMPGDNWSSEFYFGGDEN